MLHKREKTRVLETITIGKYFKDEVIVQDHSGPSPYTTPTCTCIYALPVPVGNLHMHACAGTVQCTCRYVQVGRYQSNCTSEKNSREIVFGYPRGTRLGSFFHVCLVEISLPPKRSLLVRIIPVWTVSLIKHEVLCCILRYNNKHHPNSNSFFGTLDISPLGM